MVLTQIAQVAIQLFHALFVCLGAFALQSFIQLYGIVSHVFASKL